MRYFLLVYTCICWLVPMLSAFTLASSYAGVSPAILAVQVVSVVVIPVNHYFLNVVYVSGEKGKGEVVRAAVMLCVVTALLAFWTFRLWQGNGYWAYWTLPVGLLLTIVLLSRTLTLKHDPQ